LLNISITLQVEFSVICCNLQRYAIYHHHCRRHCCIYCCCCCCSCKSIYNWCRI